MVGLPWAKSFVERFAQYLDGFQEFPGFDGIPERDFEPNRMKAFLAGCSSFDIAIQLHGDGSVTNRFLTRLRPRLAAGFFPAGQRCPDPARFIPYSNDEHEIRRLLKLMHHLGIPPAGEDLEFPLTHGEYHEANQIATASRLRPGQFVCMHAGARDAKRRWSLENFVRVGEVLTARGLRIVLTGTSDEEEQATILRARLGDSCLDLTGKTSLGGLGALLKQARLLISNDTGISHVAAALEVPSVIVFSASDPRRWAPLDTKRHRQVGDPVASPVVGATPEAVLREAFSLLAESPLRVLARDGGFPVLPSVNWSRVKRVLLVQDGSEADIVLLAPAVSALRSQWPALALLTSTAGAEVACLFPGIDRLLIAGQHSLGEAVSEGAVRELVDQLRAGSFDAAILFTRADQNPYTAAYICYLAGIPIRVGASSEFGGALLSHWVRKLDRALDPGERHLALLRAAALPSHAKDSGIAVPPGVEARMKDALYEEVVGPRHGIVLLDDLASQLDRADTFAERLRNVTGMQALGRGSLASVPDLAAAVGLSDLVITGDPLTSRLADAFRRPLIAIGSAATSSDGWRPRRSFSKLLDHPSVSHDQLLQEARTLLWLGPVTSHVAHATAFLRNPRRPSAEQKSE